MPSDDYPTFSGQGDTDPVAKHQMFLLMVRLRLLLVVYTELHNTSQVRRMSTTPSVVLSRASRIQCSNHQILLASNAQITRSYLSPSPSLRVPQHVTSTTRSASHSSALTSCLRPFELQLGPQPAGAYIRYQWIPTSVKKVSTRHIPLLAPTQHQQTIAWLNTQSQRLPSSCPHPPTPLPPLSSRTWRCMASVFS